MLACSLQKVEAMDRLVNNAMMRSTQQSDRLAVVKDTLAALEPQLAGGAEPSGTGFQHDGTEREMGD